MQDKTKTEAQTYPTTSLTQYDNDRQKRDYSLDVLRIIAIFLGYYFYHPEKYAINRKNYHISVILLLTVVSVAIGAFMMRVLIQTHPVTMYDDGEIIKQRFVLFPTVLLFLLFGRLKNLVNNASVVTRKLLPLFPVQHLVLS